ncbi:LLM class flavin-dependent oxidoreductase [Lysinibacillus fusiformis]|uniref:LLM class flavin-dependent oxidoreductase n=1 Tax=Lysinibacillus TaxID=400634 RepID=UPI00215A3AF5|nr:LLM class flavin-dependent oxidoreductase [Lysinibacillus fusiformis]MCR8853508.1 LLM class flavin-dependent oxidoreductase [Lysinibacillus fusiformis]
MSNTIKNEIKGYISSSGWTITDIVEKMNESLPTEKKTTVQNISNKLTRGTIKYSEVIEIADIIGMKIEWNKKEDAQ